MSFQCNWKAADIVCSTGPTRWRLFQPSRNDAIIFRMGTGPDSRIWWTAGCITTRFKYLIIVEDAESSVTGHLALDQRVPHRAIHHSARLVIIVDRYELPNQPLHGGSYWHRSLFGIWSSWVITVSMTEAPVHLDPLTPLADSTQWNLCNITDFNAFKIFTCRISDSMLKVNASAIYSNLMIVKSGC